MKALITAEAIERKILIIRGQKVMLSGDLAELYAVEPKTLNQAVKRKKERFPGDFMFRLTKDEFDILRSQSVTSSQWGGTRYPPYAFTEQGVAMLSSVLNSPRAISVNIEIMRAFVRLRQLLASHTGLSRKLDALGKNMMPSSKLSSTLFANSWLRPTRSAVKSVSRQRRRGDNLQNRNGDVPMQNLTPALVFIQKTCPKCAPDPLSFPRNRRFSLFKLPFSSYFGQQWFSLSSREILHESPRGMQEDKVNE